MSSPRRPAPVRPVSGSLLVLSLFLALAAGAGAPAMARTAVPTPAQRAPSDSAAFVEAPSQAPAPGITASGITAPDAEIAAFIEGYVADAMDRSGLPGGVVVAVRDGRVILARGYGWADYAARRHVDVDRTLFRLASISKTFTWLMVMQLVEAGQLELDRDVNEYLDFEIPEAFGAPITLRHLMTHSSGFADRVWGVFSPEDPIPPLGDQLRANVPERVYSPGTTVAYSNYGSALAAYIVERATGESFEQLVRERIYEPVGMTRSTFAQPLPESLVDDLAAGYPSGSREPLDFYALPVPPAGGMSATATDMGRYLTMLMNDGAVEGGWILPAGVVEEMLRLEQPLGPGLRSGLGLGFMVGQHRGVRYAGHGGNLPSTATDLQLLPDHGLGWYVAFNGQGSAGAASELRATLVRAVIDRFVVVERHDAVAGIPQAGKDAPQTGEAHPQADAADSQPGDASPQTAAEGSSTAMEVAGAYLSTRRPHSGPPRVAEPTALVEILAEDDGAIRVTGARRSDGTLRRWLPDGPDRWIEEETGAPLVVTRDQTGEVTRFASALVYPVAVFEPAPWITTVAEMLFLLAFGVLLFAALAQPLGWFLRKGFRATRPGPSSDLGRWTRPLARLAVWLIVATVAGWMVLFTRVGEDFLVLFEARISMTVLAVLSILSAVFAAVIAVDAVVAWRDPARGLPRKLGLPLVALAAIVMTVLLYTYDLTSLSTDF